MLEAAEGPLSMKVRRDTLCADPERCMVAVGLSRQSSSSSASAAAAAAATDTSETGTCVTAGWLGLRGPSPACLLARPVAEAADVSCMARLLGWRATEAGAGAAVSGCREPPSAGCQRMGGGGDATCPLPACSPAAPACRCCTAGLAPAAAATGTGMDAWQGSSAPVPAAPVVLEWRLLRLPSRLVLSHPEAWAGVLPVAAEQPLPDGRAVWGWLLTRRREGGTEGSGEAGAPGAPLCRCHCCCCWAGAPPVGCRRLPPHRSGEAATAGAARAAAAWPASAPAWLVVGCTVLECTGCGAGGPPLGPHRRSCRSRAASSRLMVPSCCTGSCRRGCCVAGSYG